MFCNPTYFETANLPVSRGDPFGTGEMIYHTVTSAQTNKHKQTKKEITHTKKLSWSLLFTRSRTTNRTGSSVGPRVLQHTLVSAISTQSTQTGLWGEFYSAPWSIRGSSRGGICCVVHTLEQVLLFCWFLIFGVLTVKERCCPDF